MLIFQTQDSNQTAEDCERWTRFIKLHMDEEDLVVLPSHINFICESHNIEYVDMTEDDNTEEGEE